MIIDLINKENNYKDESRINILNSQFYKRNAIFEINTN